MDQDISELVTIIGVVTALAVAYAKAFGSYQAAITQAFVDACLPESTLDERIEAEAGQVADVEDDRMALGDRLRVQRFRRQYVEQGARTRTVALVPVERVGAIDAAECSPRRDVWCGGGQRLMTRLHVTTLSRMHGDRDATVPSYRSPGRTRRRGRVSGRCRRQSNAPAREVSATPARPRCNAAGHGSGGRS